MKKIISICMTTIMVMALSITAFAADNTSKTGMINPQANTAPPITSVKIEEGYYLKDDQGSSWKVGHYIVPVRTMGYGSVLATFDGESVQIYDKKGILGAGNIAVGWINYFDCGKPLPGEYLFEVKARGWQSTNVIKASAIITIPEEE